MGLPGLTFIEVVKQMPLLPLPVRTTVAELNGERVLYSPASTLSVEELRKVGEFTVIVAPSLLHTGGVPNATKAHPTAKVWGPEGCREKHPEVRWDGVFGRDVWPYEEQLPVIPLAGMPKVNEAVVLHRRSKTLLMADLVFNLVDARGLGAWILLHLFGTYRRMGVSKLFLKYVKDKDAFLASVAKVAAWDCENLAPGHGALIVGGGKAKLQAALRERRLLP